MNECLRRINYLRISPTDQNPGMQADALKQADCTELYEAAGISRGESIYVAWESAAHGLCTVHWERTRWVCACEHKRAVNEFIFQQSHKQKH